MTARHNKENHETVVKEALASEFIATSFISLFCWAFAEVLEGEKLLKETNPLDMADEVLLVIFAVELSWLVTDSERKDDGATVFENDFDVTVVEIVL